MRLRKQDFWPIVFLLGYCVVSTYFAWLSVVANG